MLNSYFSLLTVYRPVPIIQRILLAFYREVATAFLLLASQSFKAKGLKNFLFQKQLRRNLFWSQLSRVLTSILLVFVFLVLGPSTNVLADWEEKVIPDNRLVVQNKIIEEVVAVEIPKFKNPVTISYISTYFSRFHQGIDLPALYGSPVHPVAEGRVVFAGTSNLGYGKLVIVRHELGYESLYAHLSEISVEEGDVVTNESLLGAVGSTGISSGNHLHLEIHLQGAAVNPLSLLK
jgi:hypothetical protein